MLGSNHARPDFDRLGGNWPNRAASRFVTAAGLRFHVQIMGPDDAPAILLVHGTGAATHSFRALLPLLAERWRVVAFDLPGHGFSATPRTDGFSLPGMAALSTGLLRAVGIEPHLAIGHSAGTGILLRMALDGGIAPAAIIGFNSALEPMEGNALMSPMAKLLFLNPFVPKIVSWRARLGRLADRLLDGTGSPIDAAGRRLYAELFNHSSHVAGALGMMANWQLGPLRRRFGEVSVPVRLVAARDDPMVPARVSREAATRIRGARYVEVERGGHLFHEGYPEEAARIVKDIAAEISVGHSRNGTTAHSA